MIVPGFALQTDNLLVIQTVSPSKIIERRRMMVSEVQFHLNGDDPIFHPKDEIDPLRNFPCLVCRSV